MAYSPYSGGSNSASPPMQASPAAYGQPSPSGYGHQQSPLPYVKAEPTRVMMGAPRLLILEQPQERFRFRYESELGGTHGQLAGRSGSDRRSFPTVKLEGYAGKATIRCELYTVSDGQKNPVPHVHTLQGRFCSNGIAEITVDAPDFTASFQGLGIIHTAKKAMVEKIMQRKLNEKIAGPGWVHSEQDRRQAMQEATIESQEINMNRVCLRFRALVQNPTTLQCADVCDPVYSDPIYNGKSAQTGELKIVQLSEAYSPCTGNKEIWLLTERVRKTDIKVRFFEEDQENREIWHSYGKISKCHHQYAIILQTPPYRNPDLRGTQRVFIQLERPSDGCVSEAKHFQYTERDQRATKRVMTIHSEQADHKRMRQVQMPSGEPGATASHQDGGAHEANAGRHDGSPGRWRPPEGAIGPPPIVVGAEEYWRGRDRGRGVEGAPCAQGEWGRGRGRGTERERPRAVDAPGSHRGAETSVRPPGYDFSVSERHSAAAAPDPRYGMELLHGGIQIPYGERPGEREQWERMTRGGERPVTRGVAIRPPTVLLNVPPVQQVPHLTQGFAPVVPSAMRPAPAPTPDANEAMDLSMSNQSSSSPATVSDSPAPSIHPLSAPSSVWSRPGERRELPARPRAEIPSPVVAYSTSNIPTVISQLDQGKAMADAGLRASVGDRIAPRSSESPRDADRSSVIESRAARSEEELRTRAALAGFNTANIPRTLLENYPGALTDGMLVPGVPSRPSRTDRSPNRRLEPADQSADRGIISVRKELGSMQTGAVKPIQPGQTPSSFQPHKTRSAPPDLIPIASDSGPSSSVRTIASTQDASRRKADSSRSASEGRMMNKLLTVGGPASLQSISSTPAQQYAELVKRASDSVAYREASTALLRLAEGEENPRRIVEHGNTPDQHHSTESAVRGVSRPPHRDFRRANSQDPTIIASMQFADVSSKRLLDGQASESHAKTLAEKLMELAPEVQRCGTARDREQFRMFIQASQRALESQQRSPNPPTSVQEQSPGVSSTITSESPRHDTQKADTDPDADNERPSSNHTEEIDVISEHPEVTGPSSVDGCNLGTAMRSHGTPIRSTPELSLTNGDIEPVSTNASDVSEASKTGRMRLEREDSESRMSVSERSSVEDDRLVIDDPEVDAKDDTLNPSSPSVPQHCPKKQNAHSHADIAAAAPPESRLLSMPSLPPSSGEPRHPLRPAAAVPAVVAKSGTQPVLPSVRPLARGAQVVDYVNTAAGPVKISIDMSQLATTSANHS